MGKIKVIKTGKANQHAIYARGEHIRIYLTVFLGKVILLLIPLGFEFVDSKAFCATNNCQV